MSVMRSWRGVVAAVAALGVVGSGCSPEPPTARPDQTGPQRYVSLGDSSASGPLTGPLVGPLGCARSSTNFPHRVAAAIGAQTFVDVSCGSAVLSDLTEPQHAGVMEIWGGEVPPQLDAVTPDTDLITIAMSGNDVGLPDVVLNCINVLPVPLGPAPFGQSCIPKYVVDGVDRFSEAVDAVRPKYLAALGEIQRRAPRARIFVIDYMAAVPQGDQGCWPIVPALPGDLVYIRTKLEQMNRMIQDVATEAGVGFIDIYGPSQGHDMCADGNTRWMNSYLFDSPGFVAHANALGHQAFARIVADAVRAK